MPSQSPNFAGFREAQNRLRETFGKDLNFFSYPPIEYPPGTQLNPESGEPYDPEVTPVSEEKVTTTVRCSVITRPVNGSPPRDQATKKALGWLKQEGIVLSVDISDYHLVRDATEVEYAGDTYTIRDDHHDYLGEYDRWLFFATL